MGLRTVTLIPFWGPMSSKKTRVSNAKSDGVVTGSAVASPWKPLGSRLQERDQKRDAILRTAAALFLKVGYDRASLNDVAAMLNISKPTLYTYFPSKDAILFEAYRYGFDMANAAILEASKAEMTGFERVCAFVHAYSKIMTQDFGMCLVRINFRVLPSDDQAKVAVERGRVDRALRSFISEGIADGSIEPCDAKFKSLAIFGAMHWIGEWYSRDGALTPNGIAERFVTALTTGLGAAPKRRRR